MISWFSLQNMARAGYLARGIVYLLLGYFALATTGGEEAGTVLERLDHAPLGSPLVVAVAIGMLGYGLFRLAAGFLDLDDDGRSAIGWVTRLGLAASGIGHVLLAFVAWRVFMDGHHGGQPEAEAAMTAFEYPGGAALVGIAGIIIIITGIGQIVSAWSGQFMTLIDVEAPRFTRFAGAAGYGARGAVFVVIGWQVVSLAIGWGGRQLGMASALELIAEREWVFPFIAAGLLLFGAFSLVVAWGIRVRSEDVQRRFKLKLRWFRG